MSEWTRAEVAAPQRAAAVVRRVVFDDFYAAELPRLVALARGLAPAHLAEDVAQEAMLVAYRARRDRVRRGGGGSVDGQDHTRARRRPVRLRWRCGADPGVEP